jgi:hypothetical protein
MSATSRQLSTGDKQTLINKKGQEFSSAAELWACLEDSKTFPGAGDIAASLANALADTND